jgi:hypothetical protein
MRGRRLFGSHGSGILRRWRGGVRGGGRVRAAFGVPEGAAKGRAGRALAWGPDRSPLRSPCGVRDREIAGSLGAALLSDAVGRIARLRLKAGAQAESLILAQNERWRRA